MYGSTTEVDEYKARVRVEAQRIAETIPGADRYVRDFLDRIDAVENPGVEVIVRVTVPADSEAEAINAVEEQVQGLALPAGWTVTVGGN